MVDGFINRTGDAVFDDTIRQGLAIHLEHADVQSRPGRGNSGNPEDDGPHKQSRIRTGGRSRGLSENQREYFAERFHCLNRKSV